MVARYGGEEFIVILPETISSNAYAVAEGIRQLISTHALFINEEQKIIVTLSRGVATFATDGATQEALVYAADSAFYTAKRFGRNQIVVYGNLNVKKIVKK